MNQNYIKNTKYEILTPNGWENFDGVIRNDDDRTGFRIHTDSGSISTTEDHRLFQNGKEVFAKNLKVGDKIDTIDGAETINLIENVNFSQIYDIFNCENHVICVNIKYLSHQCDEFAFLGNLAADFWTSIRPTLGTTGRCIITSTPNSDDDQFARIWKDASNTIDEYGKENPGGVGRNNFKALKVTWDRNPDRSADWALKEIQAIGRHRFAREHNCLVGSTSISIQDENLNISTVTIKSLFDHLPNEKKYDNHGDIEIFKSNNQHLKVSTNFGYDDFDGVALMGWQPIIQIVLDDGSAIECTWDHCLYRSNLTMIRASELCVGTELIGIDGSIKTIIVIQDTEKQEAVYDLINVKNNLHSYWTNHVLSKNCEFVAEDPTLIDSIFLSNWHGVDEKYEIDKVRWYQDLKPNHTYLVALDPSLGNVGSDPSAIQVFELPGMTQVAEWKYDRAVIKEQIHLLLKILKRIDNNLRGMPEQKGPPEIYWTVESTGIGHVAIEVIENVGEERFPGVFMNELRGRGRTTRRVRGLNTSPRNKIAACSKVKALIESGRLTIYSKALISEFKNYIERSNGFSAKWGNTDDLVSATLVIIRMMDIIQNWDPDLTKDYKETIEDDEDGSNEPLPMSIMIM